MIRVRFLPARARDRPVRPPAPRRPAVPAASSRGGCRSRRSRRSGRDRRLGSAPARRPAWPRRAPSLGGTFFSCPPEVSGDHPTHRRVTHSNPPRPLPPRAQLFERRVGMPLQVRQQPGLQPGLLRPWRTRSRRLGQAPRLPLPTTPARQRRRRDPEQPDHLRPGRPQIQRIERPDPQISRIRLHAHSLTKRSPFRQGAVGRTITTSGLSGCGAVGGTDLITVGSGSLPRYGGSIGGERPTLGRGARITHPEMSRARG